MRLLLSRLVSSRSGPGRSATVSSVSKRATDSVPVRMRFGDARRENEEEKKQVLRDAGRTRLSTGWARMRK